MNCSIPNVASPPQPIDVSSDRPLFFVHIPKAAGTSISQFLVNRFPHGTVQGLYDAELHVVQKQFRQRLGDAALEACHRAKTAGTSIRKWLQIPSAAIRRLYRITNDSPPAQDIRPLCYHGHEVYRFAEILRDPPVVMTVLRDPVERAVSAFYYYRAFYRARSRAAMREAGVPEALLLVCDQSLSDFLRNERYARQFLGNRQTAMFSFPTASIRVTRRGVLHISARDATSADLEVAKQNLARCVVVGLAERLADSIRLMCHTFGWPVPNQVPWENRTADRKEAADHDPDTLQKLRDLTSLDAELYRFGVELFQRQLATIESRPFSKQETGNRQPAVAFTFDQPIPGHGWHVREASPHGEFCWSANEAWLELPIAGRGALQVRLRVLQVVHPSQIERLEVVINGKRLQTSRQRCQPGWILEGSVCLSRAEQEAGKVRIVVRVPPVRPCDALPASADTRPLGVAVQAVELRFAEAISLQAA